MKTKSVFHTGGKNNFTNAKSAHAIEVLQDQSKAALFTVIYGLQVKKGLTYSEACSELGACILHMQACDGIVNNDGAY